MPNRIIFLNGYPAVGKLSIARALHAQLPPSLTRLLDNHTIIDLAAAVIPGRGPSHQALRTQIRSVAFAALAEQFALAMSTPETPAPDVSSTPNIDVANTNAGLTAIFTGCLSTDEELHTRKNSRAVLGEYLALARDSKVPFYMFNLTCERAEHHRRLQDPARFLEGKGKLRNPARLDAQLQGEWALCHERTVTAAMLEGVEFRFWELDTTGLSVEESAREILRRVGGGEEVE